MNYFIKSKTAIPKGLRKISNCVKSGAWMLLCSKNCLTICKLPAQFLQRINLICSEAINTVLLIVMFCPTGFYCTGSIRRKKKLS